MGGKTYDNDTMLGRKLDKPIGAVRIVSVENQKVVLFWCGWSGIWLEVPLNPLQTKFLVCPPFWRNRNA
jgi:hypothetical protein